MPTSPIRRGFALNRLKLLAAGVLAAGGVLLAVRGLLPTRSERTDQAKPRIVTADGTAQVPQHRDRPAPDPVDLGWTEGDSAYTFQRVANASDARNLADALGRAVDASGEAGDGLGGDLVGLLAPAIAGEGSARDAILALGDTDHDSSSVLDAIMQAVLKHASADPAGIKVSTPDEPPAALGNMSVNRSRTTDVDAEGNEIERDVISLMTSFERTFPDALADNAAGRLRTVEIPMRSKDAEGNRPDLRLVLTLRYSKTAQAWQPAGMTIDSTDPDLMRRVLDAVRKVQNATPSAEQEGGN